MLEHLSSLQTSVSAPQGHGMRSNYTAIRIASASNSDMAQRRRWLQFWIRRSWDRPISPPRGETFSYGARGPSRAVDATPWAKFCRHRGRHEETASSHCGGATRARWHPDVTSKCTVIRAVNNDIARVEWTTATKTSPVASHRQSYEDGLDDFLTYALLLKSLRRYECWLLLSYLKPVKARQNGKIKEIILASNLGPTPKYVSCGN